MIYQIIILALTVAGWGINLAKHGEPKDGKYNLWISAVVCIINIWLMYMGGFFHWIK
jgi:hypothetical protein